MQLRRPGNVETAASSSSPTAPLWTQLSASASSSSQSPPVNTSPSPAARSGHAMTLLPPTASVLLFGGADGKVFFEDVFLLEPSSYAGSGSRSGRVATRSSSREEPAQDVHWKRLVVSCGSSFSSQSPRTPMFSGAAGHSASPRAVGSGLDRRGLTFVHPGGGRDYHTMHYVQSSQEDERARGLRVLVVGNVVVAGDEAAAQGGGGAQVEGGAAMAFDAQTLRVEELRVRQPMLEAQWEPRRVDSTSMWKPRARHAHSSVVVGREQVFVFGGKDATSSTFFNDIFYYDAPLNQWVKPTVNPTGQLPQPRAFAGLTASDDGSTLFLFGGTDGKQEFGSLFLFDVAHSRWDSLAGATIGDRPSCRINHSLTFAAPSHLVLFGGRRRAVRQNELFIYNVNTRAWRLIHGGQSDGLRSSRRRSSQTTSDHKVPVGRTAHATVLFHSEPAGPHAVQKLLVFGGYAGSHQWLDDLYLLSLPQAVLMQPPPTVRSSSRLTATSQRPRPLRGSINTVGAAARVALSAPQHPVQTRQSSQLTRLPEESSQSMCLLQQSAPPSEDPPLSLQTTQPLQEPSTEPVELEHQPAQMNPEQPQQPQLIPQISRAPMAPASLSSREPPQSESSRADTMQLITTTTVTTAGSGVLTDITNQPASNSQKQQQQSVMPRTAGVLTTDAASPGALKKHKRRRLLEDSQESNSNSNSTNSSGELITAQVGFQTTLLQLLQHQPRVEDTLARILSMLTRERTARQQQSMNQETLMRVHSEEQSKRIEAATRRNEALEGRLARSEAERAELHEKLMIRETELYMHKHSLETAIPPLNARVEAIESSHMQQLTVSRVIESKISAVYDFMDELRNAGGEGTEAENSPQRRQGCDDSVETQPTPSPPKPLLYPQRVVLAMEEKIRVIQSEKEALEARLKEAAEKLKRVEGREAQARQFLFSWCQGDNPPPAMLANAPTTNSTESESANTGTDNMTNSVES